LRPHILNSMSKINVLKKYRAQEKPKKKITKKMYKHVSFLLTFRSIL